MDKAVLQAEARGYLRKAAHLPDAEVTFEGTADIFGYKFLVFSFHLADWGDFWLVRGEQGYGVYPQSEYETIPEAILEHFDSQGTDVELHLAAHFPPPPRKTD